MIEVTNSSMSQRRPFHPLKYTHPQNVIETGKDSVVFEDSSPTPSLWRERDISTFHSFDEQLRKAKQYYTLREPTEVLQFIEKHPDLLPLLLEIYHKLEAYFPSSLLSLRVVDDPEAIDDIPEAPENQWPFKCNIYISVLPHPSSMTSI